MNDFFEILKINYYSFVDACYFVYSEFSCLASENQQDFFENSDFSDPEMKGSTLKRRLPWIESPSTPPTDTTHVLVVTIPEQNPETLHVDTDKANYDLTS